MSVIVATNIIASRPHIRANIFMSYFCRVKVLPHLVILITRNWLFKNVQDGISRPLES